MGEVARRSRPGMAIRLIANLAQLVVFVGICLPMTAYAACKEVFFDCNLGDKDADGNAVLRSTNLRSLRSGGRKDEWIAKKCKVSYADPSGCSWRGGGGPVGPIGAGQTIVLSDAAPVVPGPAPKRDHFYWELHEGRPIQAVRFGEWKAVKNGPNAALELYDLKTDSAESRDLAGDQPALVAKAEQLLKTARVDDPNWPLAGRSPGKTGKKSPTAKSGK